ncbi:unnamed protein product [Phyllotreta striolata]|uniref:Lipase domain-containing protein n=1 Tax=Phyllotreta striolata TaxID=444603 RepID=A0A9N9TF35_PHYSR|nr:unnamed protein product [Phyllotreta striolata]
MASIKLLLLWGVILKMAGAGDIIDTLFPVTESDVKFFFSNQNTENILVNISDPQDVAKTGFSKEKDSFFCANALLESPLISDYCKDIRIPLLLNYDVNYFHIDWRPVSNNFFTAFSKVPEVSEIVSRSISNMVETSGLNLTKSQIVGGSLAAQLAGKTGQNLAGKFYQVIGLDPALPGFENTDYISKDSGQFVQIIHTGGGSNRIGQIKPLGHADYYANGGKKQPGCDLELTGLCSHIRVIPLYIKTLLNSTQFLATSCDSEENYNNGTCRNNNMSYVGGYMVDRNEKILVNISDPQDVAKTGFSKEKDSFFCANAFMEFPHLIDSCEDIRKPLLLKYDVNYFHIDWRSVSNNIFTALSKLPRVSEVLSRRISNMIETSGLDLSRSQIVGASLGAQLIGKLGRNLDGKFYQVIGLDPAGVGFKNNHYLSKDSGQFVQIIHTGGGRNRLGILFNLLFPITDSSIKFYFYNQNDTNSTTPIDISDPDEVSTTGFSNTKDTFFCIHGFNEKSFDPHNSCQKIKKTVLASHDINFIMIDWSGLNGSLLYTHLVDNALKIARIIAGKILDMVDTSELNLNRSQIVGASLGGQLAGAVGTALDGSFYQVIGLDPAGVLFFSFDMKYRLSQESGQFVQVIHTNGGYIGYYDPLGHADYYANGGQKQPRCGFDRLGFGGCSHTRAVDIYLDTLINGTEFLALRCDSQQDYDAGRCKDNGKSYVGGYLVDRNASGKYFFTDNMS